MLCQRCRGLLIHETFGNLREETDRMCLATRCINYGCIEDSVVRANRLRPPAAKRSVPHRTVRKGGVEFRKNRSEDYRTI
jgi:hypothetical protein